MSCGSSTLFVRSYWVAFGRAVRSRVAVSPRRGPRMPGEVSEATRRACAARRGGMPPRGSALPRPSQDRCLCARPPTHDDRRKAAERTDRVRGRRARPAPRAAPGTKTPRGRPHGGDRRTWPTSCGPGRTTQATHDSVAQRPRAAPCTPNASARSGHPWWDAWRERSRDRRGQAQLGAGTVFGQTAASVLTSESSIASCAGRATPRASSSDAKICSTLASSRSWW